MEGLWGLMNTWKAAFPHVMRKGHGMHQAPLFFRAAFADKLYSHCWMASNGPASSNINTFWLDWLLDSLASKIPVSGIKS